jgi:hypothetical protein
MKVTGVLPAFLAMARIAFRAKISFMGILMASIAILPRQLGKQIFASFFRRLLYQ